jgi:nucleotide-binding universal stress UspA family protein
VIKTELVTTRSSIESAIVNYAERNRVDLIVIGLAGHSGFKKLVLGSVASGVIKHSHCPVMMIKWICLGVDKCDTNKISYLLT